MVTPFRMGSPYSIAIRFPAEHELPHRSPLVPVLGASDEYDPDVDSILTAVARDAAAGSVAARNALFFALEPKIDRFVRRTSAVLLGSNTGTIFDHDDVKQEAFVVFAELVSDWPGGESFWRYFFGHFPWALRNSIRKITRGTRYTTSSTDGVESEFDSCDFSNGPEEQALLNALAESLSGADGRIHLWKIRDEESFVTIGSRLGADARTVKRAWERILTQMKDSLNVTSGRHQQTGE
jgi:DNA-directed RNA polymerase specialized sigma24 family protein